MRSFVPLLAFLALSAATTASAASPPPDVEFRWRARDVYKELLIGSCEAPPSFNRVELLAGEQQKVRTFEAAVLSSARAQLDIARADVEFQLKVETSCYNDSDLWFANSHVQHSRGVIKHGLGRLKALAPALSPTLPPSILGAKQGPEFRHLVRQLIESSSSNCRISARAENAEILAPARAEIRRFRERLEGTAHAIHYDIAEADANLERSLMIPECMEPRPEAGEELVRELLTGAMQHIAAIETILKSN